METEKVCVWPDGAWCFLDELWEMTHRSNDYFIEYFDEEKHQ